MDRDGYASVVNGATWVDGSDNESRGKCDGVYNLRESLCESYTSSRIDLTSPLPTGPSPSTMAPTKTPTLGVTDSPTSIENALCTFEPAKTDCVEVSTYTDFKAAILFFPDETQIVFCGGFRFRKPDTDTLNISRNLDIRCEKLCTIFGRGTHMMVTGEETQVRIHNFKLSNSDDSAIQVLTRSPMSTTTICGVQFWR